MKRYSLILADPPWSDACTLWPGARTTAGYGTFSENGRSVYAHRRALELSLGRPLAVGAKACHTCDTPACVNPNHLFEGTSKANAADMVAKNRQARGERHSQAKLTEQDVCEIRRRVASGETHRSVAPSFGVNERTINKIISGKRWGWLK